MPDRADVSVAVAQAHERRNVFLAPDGACEVSKRSDARWGVDVNSALTGPAGATSKPRAHDPSRRGTRVVRRCRPGFPSIAAVRRSAAAMAIAAVTATLLGFALDQPNQRPPRARDVAPPATVAPAVIEPRAVLRGHGVAEAAKPRHAPTPRARSRLKPTRRCAPPRTAARRAAPRRSRTRARPTAPSPGLPIPSPSSPLSPSPTPAPSAAPALPAPVPADSPPEFM